jgi:acid phosphatase (class A)
MRFSGALMALGCVALSACQTAPATPPPSAQSPSVSTFFAGAPATAIVDGRVFLPPPPTVNSALDRADRAIARGPWSAERIEQARQDNAIDPFAAFDEVLGADFRADRLPATRALLMRVARDVGMASQAPKNLYNKPRPFVRDASQATCVTPDEGLRNSGSYPSGHSAIGWAWGLTLVELYPAQADALLRRAYGFGESRVVCGVHWRTDMESGQLLGAAGLARLHADPTFQAQLEAARAELSAR